MLVSFGPYAITFPANWQQVTLGQFLALSAQPLTNRFVLQSLASHPELVEAIPDPLADQRILASLSFISSPPDFASLPCPASLTIGGKVIALPESIGLETLGQKLAADDATKEIEEYDYITPALALLGIYLYPALSGQPFTSLSDYEAYNADLLTLPAVDALSVAAFFLTSYRRLTPSGRVIYQDQPAKMIPYWRQPGSLYQKWKVIVNMNWFTA